MMLVMWKFQILTNESKDCVLRNRASASLATMLPRPLGFGKLSDHEGAPRPLSLSKGSKGPKGAVNIRL
jgi:hypothetical protein